MSQGYYRVGDFYFDTAANALYRCTGAGTKSTSTWTPIGGGGGASIKKLSFVSDQGDYILASGLAAAVTTLATAFGNAATVTTLSVTSAAGIVPGQTVTGTGIGWGVIVISVAGTTVTTSGFTSTAASSGNYTFGAAMCVAKPPKIRCSVSSEQYVDGSGVHTFTYASAAFGGVNVAFNRTNAWGSGSQTEAVTPAYLPGGGGANADSIYAITITTENLPLYPGNIAVTVPVSLLDIHDRDWALLYTNS